MEKLLALARRHNLEAEFYHERSHGITLGTAGSAVKFKSSEFCEGYSVRVLHQGRIGFAYFERLADAEKTTLLAKKLSSFSPKSGFSFAQKQKYAKIIPYDKRVAAITPEDAVSHAKEMLKSASSIKGAIPTEGSISFSTGGFELASSSGLFSSSRSTGLSIWCGANFKGSTGGASFSHYKFEDKFAAVGKEAAQVAKRMHTAKKIPQKKMTVIFGREALHSLLHGILLPSLNGDWARRKISKFTGLEGKQVASECFTLSDDPFADAAGLSPFDGEGVAAKRIPLIEKGIFRSFLFDRLTASLAQVDAQGSCARGSYLGSPSISPSNLSIAPGTIRNLESEFPNSLIVRDFHGEHTANKVTGDFSVSLDAAFLADGKSVRGNLLSSNIFEMLKNIAGAEKGACAYADMVAPRVAFGDILIVG
jgi:PmbA protein